MLSRNSVRLARALAVRCVITELALAGPAFAGDDLRTGIGTKELCADSQHSGVCEQQIQWAYQSCRRFTNGPPFGDVDTCAVAVLVRDIGDIRGTFNMLKLDVERPRRYLIGQ
jgi:hypothetical protein